MFSFSSLVLIALAAATAVSAAPHHHHGAAPPPPPPPAQCNWTCVAVNQQTPPVALTSWRGPYHEQFRCSYGRDACYYDRSGALAYNSPDGTCPPHAEGGC